MTLLLQSYGFEDVTVACTIDGAKLSWKIGHITTGVIITDPRACNPRKNDELVMGADGTEGVQSRDLCFPLQVTIGKDNKQLLHKQFKPFYTEINWYEDKFTYHNIVDQSCRSFSIAHPADMSALQKLVGRGGVMKNCTYSCYCCNIHIDQVHVPNLIPCEFCSTHSKTRCYHHEVCVPELWQRFKEECKEMLVASLYLANLLIQQSFVRLAVSVAGVAEGDA